MVAIRLGLVGIGKIARDQHVPVISRDERFELAATASRHGRVEGVPAFPNIEEMIAAGGLDAVSLCTPPAGRHALARAAIEAGLHVMLEKPPAATLSEAEALAAAARARGVALFATWHSREAAGVLPARDWLADRRIDAVRIEWKEDIRRWHPGQEWILNTGGFGVFDPGINALSIVTALLPGPVLLRGAVFDTPRGRASPIAATLDLEAAGVPVSAAFDFLQTGPQTWTVEVDTDAGTMRLRMGGSELELPGQSMQRWPNAEYPSLYAAFAERIAARQVDADLTPLRLVADAFLVAERRTVEPFSF